MKEKQGPNIKNGKITFTSLQPPSMASCSKEEILRYFENSFDIDDSLFSSIIDESSYLLCPDRLRLPLIFYVGHTAAVYVNKLVLADLVAPEERPDKEFEALFETGVDEMSWDDVENFRLGGKFLWPSCKEVWKYRADVRQLVIKTIQNLEFNLPIEFDSKWWVIMLCIEHHRIHIETSSVLLRQLPVELLCRPDGFHYAPHSAGEPVMDNPMVKIEGQSVTLGKPYEHATYAWDSYYGKLDCNVASFEVSKYPITNREFLKFIEAGGYENRELWSEEGWKWRSFRQARHPTFWVCDGGCKSGCGAALADHSHCNIDPDQLELLSGFSDVHDGSFSETKHVYTNGDFGANKFGLRCMFDVVKLPLDWPVEVNFLEAKAYCCWRGDKYRLPIEAEYAIMRLNFPPNVDNNDIKTDPLFSDNIVNYNLNLRYGSSSPVNMHPENKFGLCDVAGNVWKWVEDVNNGLPGFINSIYYDDFSTPMFDGMHNNIMGGSWISSGSVADRFGRFAFRRHFFQHAGFHIAYNTADVVDLPVMLLDKPVFAIGQELQDHPLYLDAGHYNMKPVESVNAQFALETEDNLALELRRQYGSTAKSGALKVMNTVVDSCIKFGVEIGESDLLLIGETTGLFSFLLSRDFLKILSVSFCARYIDACLKIQAHDTGTLPVKNIAVPANCRIGNILFKQLTWITMEIIQHKIVFVANLHLFYRPISWLLRMKEILHKEGLLVLHSLQPIPDDVLNWLEDRFTVIGGNQFGHDNGIVSFWKYI